MPSPSVRRLTRFLAIAVPTAVAMALAACSSPLGPRERSAPAVRHDSASVAQRAAQLTDSSLKTNTPPWY